MRGTEAAYASLHEQLLTTQLAEILQEWIYAPSWLQSQRFAAANASNLLHPTTWAILENLSAQNPGDQTLRLHRGLLAYAATAGFDAAYELSQTRPSGSAYSRSRPGTPASTRLALARLHSGQSPTTPKRTSSSSPPPCSPSSKDRPARPRSAAALTDCAGNAAPYERRDFTRRLAQLGSEQPHLASLTAELQQILNSEPN